jgi:amino acid adenylation domain-containing protein
MAELLAQYEGVLMQIADKPEQRLSQFSLVTSGAAKVLPDPVKPLCAQWCGAVHSTFAQNAQQVPQRLAVADANEQWTYEQLDQHSNQLANYLLANGIQSQDMVAIYGHRSAALVWAVLGVLKAGAGFLILDPAYPAARLIEYLRMVVPRAWIQIRAAGILPDLLQEYLTTSGPDCRLTLSRRTEIQANGMLGRHLCSDPGVVVGPDDLAYILFTSGSTGRPKGILGTHGPVSHFLHWHCEKFDLDQSDRFSLLSGLAHDPVLRDIFTPLWLSAALYIPEQQVIETPGELAAWMKRHKITVAHLTPPMGRILTEGISKTTATGDDSLSLRYFFFGGASLTEQDIARIRNLAPSATLVNYYGATETPQAMGYFVVPELKGTTQEHALPETRRIVPLGRGIEGVQLLVLNAEQKLTGLGEKGEIYVRTPYLAVGYLGDERLTQERFIANPLTSVTGDTVFRTGDLGRYLTDGNIEFLGRGDRQVKIRGYRIELGEVEATLAQHPEIQDVAVMVREGETEDGNLVAYFVPGETQIPTGSELREFVKQKLPVPMIPMAFVKLDALPLTANGKVDYRALPAQDRNGLEPGAGFVPAQSPTEKTLAGIWSKLFGAEQVGVHDNFFELGGHSLLAIRVLLRMRDTLGVALPLRSIFETPTIAGLASSVETLRWLAQDPGDDAGSNLPQVLL